MSLRLIIAGGGTGGHVYPGIALAEAFLERHPDGTVSFVGTDEGLEARAVPARGFGIDFVPSGQVRGKGIVGLSGAVRMARGLRAAFAVLAKRRPDLVIGVGGYASVPVAVAAALSGVPLFLQEQNAVPGRANRWLAAAARRVYVGFAGAVPYFRAGRATVTGNPLRKEVVEAARASAPPPFPPPMTVLAWGGSQGARAVNERVLAMARLVRDGGKAMRFLLQAGAREYGTVRAAVEKEALPVEPFAFTDDVGAAFSRSHAVLMRAGALSIAEAALFGKPSVLIPYPFAADAHQERNAREYCGTGAGTWMPQDEATPERVLSVLERWGNDAPSREAAARAAKGFARPEAAAQIVAAALTEIGRVGGGARV